MPYLLIDRKAGWFDCIGVSGVGKWGRRDFEIAEVVK